MDVKWEGVDWIHMPQACQHVNEKITEFNCPAEEVLAYAEGLVTWDGRAVAEVAGSNPAGPSGRAV
jgi:hypothetical protein